MLALALLAPGVLSAQTIAGIPDASQSAKTSFVLEHLEVPREIGLGTMAINVWARVALLGGDPIAGVTLLLKSDDRRIEMKSLDGAFDSAVEDVVATIDTFTWMQGESHEFEIRAHGAALPPATVATAAIRVKPRIATPDLFLLDESGRAGAWIGSGAGGFTPVAPLDAGNVFGRLELADLDQDRLVDLVLPTQGGKVRIFRNRGAGRFVEGSAIDCGPDLIETAVGDLDGDGRADLVTISADRALEIRLRLSPEPVQSSLLTLAPDRLELADLDGDRRREIYVALLGLEEGEIQVWTGRQGETWAPRDRLDPGAEGRKLIQGLVGVPDPGRSRDRLLVLSWGGSEGMLESWVGGADTRPESKPVLRATVRIPGEPLYVTWGRFRVGGRESWLVLAREHQGAAFYGAGEDDASPIRLGGMDSVPTDLCALDVDNDGDDDLVTGGDLLRVWINVQGRGFREAGESPYFLDARVLALVSGSLDERSPAKRSVSGPVGSKE
jgi:hypothetical protein